MRNTNAIGITSLSPPAMMRNAREQLKKTPEVEEFDRAIERSERDKD